MIYSGVCRGGPYDGQIVAKPSQDFPVVILLPGTNDRGVTNTMTVNYRWCQNYWSWQGGIGPWDEKERMP